MSSKTLFTAVALAALSLLTACGGGDAADDNVANLAQADGVGGIGGSGGHVAGVGGIGGSGGKVDGVGGIGGSGGKAEGVGGIGGSGGKVEGVGGIGGSGGKAEGVGGIGGSGGKAEGVGGLGGSGIQAVAVAHACALKSINVTIAGARLNPDGAADLGSEGWVDVALASPVRVDLLALAAGGSLPLDLSGLPSGTYRQMRLLLVAGNAAEPLSDSVVGAGGIETALAVPSVAQGGLPLAVRVSVAGGQVAASYAGLDVCGAVASSAGTYALAAVTGGASQVASAY
jgi:hypothetical protein